MYILLNKIHNLGIKGNFFNIIRNIYSNDESMLKIDGKCSGSFQISQGVRQGCVLSPLLFNIFMSGLAKNLMTMDDKLSLGNSHVNSLFWADDIVLLAKNGEQLKEMIRRVSEFCGENKLSINPICHG